MVGGTDLWRRSAGTTLTLGPSLTVNQTGRAELYATTGDAIVNTGTINAGVTSGVMYLRGGGSFTNQGAINVSNGDDFDVAAGVAFSNSGTIALGSAAKLHLRDNLATGAIGTVRQSGGTVFIDGTLTQYRQRAGDRYGGRRDGGADRVDHRRDDHRLGVAGPEWDAVGGDQ